MIYTDSNLGRLDWNKSDAATQVGAAYHWPINDKWLLGVGVTYDLNDTNAGIATYRGDL